MDRLEFLVEEPSIAEVLKVILPKILPQGWILNENFFVRPHQGKSDLKKSIPRKFQAFSELPFNTGIIVVQDQDANDCRQLKQELSELCNQSNTKPCPFRVRIVCHELESWYFGDPKAIETVFPHLFKVSKYKNKDLCKHPDSIITPKNRLKRIVREYSQIDTAKKIAAQMDVNANKSESFNQFKNGITSLIQS